MSHINNITYPCLIYILKCDSTQLKFKWVQSPKGTRCDVLTLIRNIYLGRQDYNIEQKHILL